MSQNLIFDILDRKDSGLINLSFSYVSMPGSTILHYGMSSANEQCEIENITIGACMGDFCLRSGFSLERG